MSKKTISRARVIDVSMKRHILMLLEEWSEKLTWDALIVSIRKSTGQLYTRQALFAHKEIADAFVVQKRKKPGSGSSVAADPKIVELNTKVERLKEENARLKSELNNYREMYIRWVKNAVQAGLTEEKLNMPLIKPDRGSSKELV